MPRAGRRACLSLRLSMEPVLGSVTAFVCGGNKPQARGPSAPAPTLPTAKPARPRPAPQDPAAAAADWAQPEVSCVDMIQSWPIFRRKILSEPWNSCL